MRRLQIVKEERKEAQNRTKALEHRLVLLLNQEKLANQKLELTRKRLKQILQKKAEYEKEIYRKGYKTNSFNDFTDSEGRKDGIHYNNSNTINVIGGSNSNSNIFQEQKKRLINDQKQKLREEILQKILEDEEERKLLEEELARIKKDEIRAVNTINGNNINERILIKSLAGKNTFHNNF
jgi:hypothetical protein